MNRTIATLFSVCATVAAAAAQAPAQNDAVAAEVAAALKEYQRLRAIGDGR